MKLVNKKQCYFCTHKNIDWKDEKTLRRFTNSQGKIVPPRMSGTCAKHQRRVARAVKRARVMGILPYVVYRF